MRWLARVGAVLILGFGLAFLGIEVYQAGMAAGAAQAAVGAAATPGGTAVPATPWPYGYGYGFHPWGFHPLSFIGAILLFFVFLALLKALVWGGARRWMGYPSRPGFRHGYWDDQLRRAHDEWHRAAGENPGERPGPSV